MTPKNRISFMDGPQVGCRNLRIARGGEAMLKSFETDSVSAQTYGSSLCCQTCALLSMQDFPLAGKGGRIQQGFLDDILG